MAHPFRGVRFFITWVYLSDGGQGMKERIDKERLHLFAPRDILVTHVEVEGIIFIEKLKEAVKNAVARNEILNSRVVIELSLIHI